MAERIWNKDEILELLSNNNKAVERALVRLYERQTAAEQATYETRVLNNAGFNATDAYILTSFSKQVLNGRTLSGKQLAIARKKLPKYHRQLLEIANA